LNVDCILHEEPADWTRIDLNLFGLDSSLWGSQGCNSAIVLQVDRVRGACESTTPQAKRIRNKCGSSEIAHSLIRQCELFDLVSVFTVRLEPEQVLKKPFTAVLNIQKYNSPSLVPWFILDGVTVRQQLSSSLPDFGILDWSPAAQHLLKAANCCLSHPLHLEGSIQ
jgi:hypothetical protein